MSNTASVSESPSGYAALSAATPEESFQFARRAPRADDVETIDIQNIEAAFERVLKSAVRCRFVIDMASLTAAGA